MDISQERLRILDMIDSGRITAEQGMQLLRALNEADRDALETETDDGLPADEPYGAAAGDEALPLPDGNLADGFDHSPSAVLASQPHMISAPFSPAAAEASQPAETIEAETIEGPSERAARLKGLWVYPLWAGIIAAALGSLLMAGAWMRNQGSVGLLFVCAAVPFVLGLLIMLLAWSSRSAPWLHLRVQQAPGASPQRIALSFPLPARTGAWFVHTFGGFIPGLRDRPVEDLLQMVQQTAVTGVPIHIEVDEGDAGEKVEIFIG